MPSSAIPRCDRIMPCVPLAFSEIPTRSITAQHTHERVTRGPFAPCLPRGIKVVSRLNVQLLPVFRKKHTGNSSVLCFANATNTEYTCHKQAKKKYVAEEYPACLVCDVLGTGGAGQADQKTRVLCWPPDAPLRRGVG